MIVQRQFQSWCVPGAVGGVRSWPRSSFWLAPTSSRSSFCGLVGNSFCRERIRLSEPSRPDDGFANLYFDVGRLIYFGAPILIGWGIALIAARQRLKAAWPGRFASDRMDWRHGPGAREPHRVAGGIEHVSMHFSLGPSLYTVVILSLTCCHFSFGGYKRLASFLPSGLALCGA